MLLNSFVFARSSENVAWHLQGRLTREQCITHRQECLDKGWKCTPIQEIGVAVPDGMYTQKTWLEPEGINLAPVEDDGSEPKRSAC